VFRAFGGNAKAGKGDADMPDLRDLFQTDVGRQTLATRCARRAGPAK
jgi:hypothetical protein